MSSTLVSVVIASWNRKDDVLETLPSIYEQDYKNYEIIVVDNGSTDGTVEVLREQHPDVILVPLSENLGATGGRNAGIDVTKGDIVFFLDSDCSMQHDTLVNTVRKFESDSKLGILGCKILNYYTGKIDGTTGWAFTSAVSPDSEFESFSFSETGSAIRRSALEEAGPFWDFLFFGREGEDLSIRVWDAGYTVIFYPEAIVHHRESPEKRVIGSQREYFDLRNCFYIYFTRYPWDMFLRVMAVKVGSATVRGIRRRNVHKTVLRALADLVRHMPYLWKERNPISRETADYYFALQRQHGPLSWSVGSWLRAKV